MKHTKPDKFLKIILVFVGIVLITTAVGLYFKRKNKEPQIKEGFREIKTIGDAFSFVSEAIEAIPKFFTWMGDMIVAAGSSIGCVFKKIGLIPKCSKWYFFDFIGKLLYCPFAFLFWIIDLQSIEDGIWEIVYTFDDMCYETIGVHFAHFPDETITDCYKFCNIKYPRWPF